MTARAAAGFTLLEVLVALVVFGFLMTGLVQGFRFGVHAVGLQAGSARRQGELEAADRALRGLLHRTARSNTAVAGPLFQGAAHTLAFDTLLPQAGEGAAQVVRVGLGVDAKHRLVLRWQPAFANPLAPPPPPATAVLLEGVDHVDFAYWQAADARGAPAGGWVGAWATDELPELVRLHLAFTDPARRWPDVVAATRGG